MIGRDDSRSAKRCYCWATALALSTLPAAAIDLQLARLWTKDTLPGDLVGLLNWSEAFAHGIGVALIALVAIRLDSFRRWHWPRTLCMAYGAGLLVNCVKLLIGRHRPRQFLELQLDSSTVMDTFAGWLPLLSNGLDHSVQSFPSGHTATACGLAVGLSRSYPQARWLFYCLAALAAAQRLNARAHYLSDVLAGAAIGLCAAGLLLDSRWLGGWFDRLESKPVVD